MTTETPIEEQAGAGPRLEVDLVGRDAPGLLHGDGPVPHERTGQLLALLTHCRIAFLPLGACLGGSSSPAYRGARAGARWGMGRSAAKRT